MTTSTSAQAGIECNAQRFSSPARLVGGLAFVFSMVGCSITPPNPQEDASYQEQATIANRPVVRPVRSLSSFSDSLSCMDHLFRDAGMATVLVSSKTIPDYSGKVAVGTKEMVITAFSQMSRVSNAFRYVDYEVDIARQDTVQNLTTLLLNNNQIRLQRPALYISGAVAFVDQRVISNNNDYGISGTRIEAGYSKNKNASVIGLEMHLGDFRSRTIIPGMDSANEIVIGNGGKGLDLAGRIGSYGVQFSVGRDYAQGSGPAIRTLVELAIIELMGKWARLPYWQCLTLDQTHPDFQRQMREWYDGGDESTRNQLIKRALLNQGYLQPDQMDKDTPELRDALSRFQADKQLVATGVIDFPTYERSLRNYVSLSADGKLSRVGWEPKSATPAPQQLTNIRLNIENILLARTSFEVGEQIFMSASVSKASYLYCYMGSANGTVIRMLPNGTNTSGWIQANQTIRIPDWMSPNPGFVMNAGVPGIEGVACFATDNDVIAKLPANLKAPAFQRIEEVTDLNMLEEAFRKANPNTAIAARKLTWQVVPKATADIPSPPTPPVKQGVKDGTTAPDATVNPKKGSGKQARLARHEQGAV
ncbi:MAG: DUF4384 domain-containing protein [Comamonas sp.]